MKEPAIVYVVISTKTNRILKYPEEGRLPFYWTKQEAIIYLDWLNSDLGGKDRYKIKSIRLEELNVII